MQDNSPADPEPRRLPESEASRLFARASELDAAHAAALEVAALRAAALEAGISARAFDAALAELQGAELARRPRRRSWKWPVAATVAALLTVTTFGVSRLFPPAGSPAGMVEESLLLQCLAPAEAVELIRPLLGHPSNTLVISPEHAPRVLTIRATPTQIREVKSLLERYEGEGSPACARR